MTRKTHKRKSPCSGKPKTTAKAPARVQGKRSAPRLTSGSAKVDPKPLGTVDVLTIKREGKGYMHVFKGQSPTLHRVEGQPGVLVLAGEFSLDNQGFIRD